MTLAEYLKQETFNEGREEGRAEGREDVARSMIEKGMDLKLILELTGLSKERIKKLNR